jgi:hypothetical protein
MATVQCSVCGGDIEVSDDINEEDLSSDIWICDGCYGPEDYGDLVDDYDEEDDL